jgi:hypothetical protein
MNKREGEYSVSFSRKFKILEVFRKELKSREKEKDLGNKSSVFIIALTEGKIRIVKSNIKRRKSFHLFILFIILS